LILDDIPAVRGRRERERERENVIAAKSHSWECVEGKCR